MRHPIQVVLVAASLAALTLNAKAADTVSLRFASPAPPMSQINTWGITPWINEVTKAAGSGLKIKLYPGPALGNFRNIMDRTINGVVELSFGTLGPYGGQFTRTEVANLPFLSESDVEESVALWRLFKSGLIAMEFEKVHPLALFTFPGSGIHSNHEIKSADDIKGVKTAVFARTSAREMELLGATPVTMTPADAYQAVQRSLVQQVMVGWSAVLPFKLQEVTKFHLDVAMGQAPAFIFMNKQAYAKLPAGPKAALDKLSYEAFSRRMGNVTDRQEDLGRSVVKKIPGHKIYKLSPEESAKWEKTLAPLAEEFAKSTPNGAAILAAFRKEIANVRAGR